MNHEPCGAEPRMSVKDAIRQAIACDDARPGMPYEHGATLAAGIALIVGALLTPRRDLAVAQGATAGFLLFRALSGREGLRMWVGAEGRADKASTMSPDAGPGDSGG